MKEIKEIIKITEDQTIALKQAYMEACNSQSFQEIIRTLDVNDDVLMKYTSSLEDAAKEFEHCQKCSSLKECNNKMEGFLYTAEKKGNGIVFSYIACPYKQKLIKENRHQKFISLYDIPKDIKTASLKDVYKDKGRIEIIKFFKNFLDHYPNDNPKGLYLHGNFGSGKTYLIAALFNELAKKEVESAIIYYPEFLRSLKASFDDDYKERFDLIKKIKVLLIDDIGAENSSSWARDEVLGTILQYRMEQGLPTFFTSNFNLEQLEGHLALTSTSIDKVKARRILERIKELTISMELIGKNYRETKKESTSV